MNRVEEIFEEKAVNRGGILMFKKYTAIEFIRKCQEFNIMVLGIDGFRLLGEKTQPCQDNSVDYSNIKEFKAVYQKAMDFLLSQL